jgi:ABC-type multidrug transport system fused ATPase/permease subunit
VRSPCIGCLLACVCVCAAALAVGRCAAVVLHHGGARARGGGAARRAPRPGRPGRPTGGRGCTVLGCGTLPVASEPRVSFPAQMVAKNVDREDDAEIVRARERADIIVRKRAAANLQKEKMVKAAERASVARGEGLADLNAPLWKIWGYLRPSWSAAFSSEFECAGMFAIALTKVVELKLQTEVVRALDRTLSSRNLADFKAGMIKGTAVACGGSLLRIIYSYLRARMTWKWRKKLTTLFHEKYFEGFNFYWLGAGGGRGMDKIEDPDSRITQDLNATINGFANYFSSSMIESITCVLQTRELLVNFGWRFAVAPYAYLITSFLIVEKLMPMRQSWRRMGHARGFSWGKYVYAANRLQDQQEAIGVLKGATREGTIIDDEYVVHLRDCTNQHWAFWKFGMLNNFFMDYATEAFVSVFCIGRGIWFPATGTGDGGSGGVTLDQIANTRSDVGVQWLLFTQTMTSARTSITMLRDVQQLIGHVERITEMLETLDRVALAKQNEKKASTITADKIEFNNVTVITPANVLLVDKLSFSLANGEVCGTMCLCNHYTLVAPSCCSLLRASRLLISVAFTRGPQRVWQVEHLPLLRGALEDSRWRHHHQASPGRPVLHPAEAVQRVWHTGRPADISKHRSTDRPAPECNQAQGHPA